MRKLFCVLALCFAVLTPSAFAGLVTAAYVVTNNPSDGNTFTINGNAYTWKTTVTTPNTQVQITNTAVLNASNMFHFLAAAHLPGVTLQQQSTATNVTVYGDALTAALTGSAWATLTLSTNTTTNTQPFLIPIESLPPANRTNIASGAVSAISLYSSNAFDQNSVAASQLIGLTNIQIISGAKAFTNNSNTFSGGTFTNPAILNGSNFGLPFRSPGTGTGSEQFGLGASATASFGVAFGDGATASLSAATAVGFGALGTGLQSTALGGGAVASGATSSATGTGATASGAQSTALGYLSIASQTLDTALGENALASGGASTAVGAGASAQFTNSTAVGAGATTTTSNQLVLGKSSQTVVVPGSLTVTGGALISGTVTNLQVGGSNTINAALFLTGYAISSLVNSNNADVVIGTNAYLQVSGPSANFYIGGFAGGADGRTFTVENSTGFIMVLGNQSGIESGAPQNKILTGFSTDRQITNSPGCVTFRYDGTVSRWKVISVN